MTEMHGLLIAGGESLVLNALVREAAREGVPCTCAPLPKDSAEFKRSGAPEGSAALLDWNAHSPLSARTLVTAARNRLAALDTALLVCAPPPRFLTVEPDAAEIDAVIDRHIKSFLFLTRELRQLFQTRQTGQIAFVAADSGALGGVLGKTVSAAFTAFAGATIATGENVLGFTAPEAAAGTEHADEFAAFVLKKLREERKTAAGKWYKYSKLPLFGR